MPTASTPSATHESTATNARASEATKGDDAIALLMADHDEADELFAMFEQADSDERKRELADKICLALRVHTRIEEEIFYPACDGKVADGLIDEAAAEHEDAKKLISKIEAMRPDDGPYDATVTALAEAIRHHVKEEEEPGGLFDQAREAGLDLHALGHRLATRRTELMYQMQARLTN